MKVAGGVTAPVKVGRSVSGVANLILNFERSRIGLGGT